MAAGDVNSEILRKQLMVNQMVNAVGCTSEQATTILQRAQWHLDVSLVTYHVVDGRASHPGRIIYHAYTYANIIIHSLHFPSQAALSLFFDENAGLPIVTAPPPVQPGPHRSSTGASVGSAHSLSSKMASYVSPFPFAIFLVLFQNTFYLVPHNMHV